MAWTIRARLESLINSVCLMSNGLANTNRINNDHRNGLKYGNTRKDTRTRMKNEIPKKLLVLSKMARRFYKRKEEKSKKPYSNMDAVSKNSYFDKII